MGRPINKKFIGDGAGKIQVTEVKFADGGTSAAEAHIVRQRSTNKFLVSDGTDTEICTLVNKLPGALGNSEFCIEAVDVDGNTYQVTKLMNRTFQIEGNVVAKWSSNPTGGSTVTELDITGASQANPCVITVADTSALTTGDNVAIKDVGGMVELNVDTGFTITVINGTTFSLDGIDATGYTLYTSGGVVTLSKTAAEGLVVDIQAS